MTSLDIVSQLFGSTKLTVGDLIFATEVYQCFPNTALSEVLAEMQKRNIGCVVITQNEKPVGIFTERDLLKKITLKEISLDHTAVEQYMTPNPVCITTDLPVQKALNYMRAGKFRHLILINADKTLKGILSVKDFLDFMVDSLNDRKSQE